MVCSGIRLIRTVIGITIALTLSGEPSLLRDHGVPPKLIKRSRRSARNPRGFQDIHVDSTYIPGVSFSHTHTHVHDSHNDKINHFPNPSTKNGTFALDLASLCSLSHNNSIIVPRKIMKFRLKETVLSIQRLRTHKLPNTT